MLRMIASGLVAMAASACSSDGTVFGGWDYRYGPPSHFDRSAITAYADDQVAVMDAFAAVAGYPQASGRTPQVYFEAMLAGYNFVDEQCELYLQELQSLERSNKRLTTGIYSLQQLTSAILTATPASKATIEITAKVFGLSSAFADTLTEGYLLGQNSASLYTLVQKMQSEYRTAAELRRGAGVSRPEAYQLIRGYLRLCTPVSIEANISDLIKQSHPKAGTDGASGSITVLAAPTH